MYVYQNGKLYVEYGVGKLVGVEIYPDKIIRVKGTETKLESDHELLTPLEVQAKYSLNDGGSYIFPMEKKEEVIPDEPTIDIKKPARKSNRK